MKLILVDINAALVEAWSRAFQGLSDVDVVNGSIFDIPKTTKCDAFVSPANSFGFMDGGIDLALSDYFGWHVQERLQGIINTFCDGELLVGQALAIETDHPNVPYCISAPTMRIPVHLTEKGNANAYLAMRAVLLLIKSAQYPIKTVAIPGLGTGIGNLDPEKCASQMRLAYNVVSQARPIPKTLWEARRLYGV